MAIRGYEATPGINRLFYMAEFTEESIQGLLFQFQLLSP